MIKTDSLLEILGGMIVGVGVITAIVLRLSEKFIEKKISQGFDAKFAVFQSEIDKKQYISRARFDAEFQIYRSLSQKYGELILMMLACASKGNRDAEDISQLVQMAYDAISELYASAPFIRSNLYKEFRKIYEKCRELIVSLEKGYDIGQSEEVSKIYNEYDILIEKVRSYTSNLDVIQLSD